tara:strand:- start:251 stop:2071 length:1821 start_codon:yes stop_codon:yes gene_type:complete
MSGADYAYELVRLDPGAGAGRQPGWLDELQAMRHRVYAEELEQYAPTPSKRLREPGKDFVLCTRKSDGALCGYVSWTPPPHTAFRMASFLTPSLMQAALSRLGITDGEHEAVFEIRSLTVDRGSRHQGIARELMMRALLRIRQVGGAHVVALGRHDVLPMYRNLGLTVQAEPEVPIGAATYSVMHCSCEAAYRAIRQYLAQPPGDGAACYHGGTSWATTGFDFQLREQYVVADVLDSPFPPCPEVMDTLQTTLQHCCMESPPTDCAPLVQAVAARRTIPPDYIAVSSGSSSLMFTCLLQLLSKDSKVLILSPMYGEYKHILTHVIGCEVNECALSRDNDFALNIDALYEQACQHDALLLVNPNSPTGQHSSELPGLLDRMYSRSTAAQRCQLVWVDETYVDYVSTAASLEARIPLCPQLLVCKSMSKVYALSGQRVAYLAGQKVPGLRKFIPPWSVSLPAQLAGVAALSNPAYYRGQYARVHAQRLALEASLRTLGFDVVPGCANFVLCFLPDGYAGTGAHFVRACRAHKLYARDPSNMGRTLGPRAVRFAVRLASDQERLLQVVEAVVGQGAQAREGAEGCHQLEPGALPGARQPAARPAPPQGT